MPPHPSPELFLSRDTLNSEASSSAERLEAQIKVIYQQFGAHTWEEFQRLAQAPQSPISLEILDKLHNLLQQLDYIRKEGKAPETETELFREMREKFGKGFLGLDEVERAFTLANGTKLIELTPQERQEAMRLLEQKLNEPDIQEFLRATPPEALARDWLLVLRVPKLANNTPLTMKAMQERLAPDMAAQGQGKLLYEVKDWSAAEPFYTTATVTGGLHWQFVTRRVVSGTLDKTHSDQNFELEKAARAAKLDPNQIRRRTPVEILYDMTAVLRATGDRILDTKDDWSDVQTSAGLLVYVGYADAGGADVSRHAPGFSHGLLGASLSR